MAMSSIHHSSALPFFSASILSPFSILLFCASSPSLLLRWQRLWVLCAPDVRVVLLSHLLILDWVSGVCVCMHVLTWERPSLPNNCISVLWCDTSARTNAGGMHSCTHTYTLMPNIFSSYFFIWAPRWQFILGEVFAWRGGERWFSDTLWETRKCNKNPHIFYTHARKQVQHTWCQHSQMIKARRQRLWYIL